MCFEYDESPKMAEERQVKCRRDYACEGCSRGVKKGTFALCCTGLFDGHWYRYYVCDRCQRLIMAIAANELLEGCPWHTAWCSPCDLAEYVEEHAAYGEEIRPLGMPTIADCRRYVDDVFYRSSSMWWREIKLIPLESF